MFGLIRNKLESAVLNQTISALAERLDFPAGSKEDAQNLFNDSVFVRHAILVRKYSNELPFEHPQKMLFVRFAQTVDYVYHLAYDPKELGEQLMDPESGASKYLFSLHN